MPREPRNPNRKPESAEIRDSDGLLVDEYSDESLVDPDAIDALDLADSLESDTILDRVAAGGDGIVEVDPDADSEEAVVDSLGDEGYAGRRNATEIGIGAELRSTDDLERAAIGRRASTRRPSTDDGSDADTHR